MSLAKKAKTWWQRRRHSEHFEKVQNDHDAEVLQRIRLLEHRLRDLSEHIVRADVYLEVLARKSGYSFYKKFDPAKSVLGKFFLGEWMKDPKNKSE